VLVIAVGSPIMVLNLQAEQTQTVNQLHRAEKAEKDATNRLWDTYLAEAQARHWSGQPGRHYQSLEALRAAAAIRYSLELRNEAGACIPRVALQVARRWQRGPETAVAFDARMERYALCEQGTVTIRRVSDDREVLSLAGVGNDVAEIEFSPDCRFLLAYGAGR